MKRVIIGLVLAMATAQTASADVYVKIDAEGNAIGGAIMCDAGTCGAGSLYSQLTLQPGERYVLQGVGVHYGIGNNNPGVDVKHEEATNEWVITREEPSQPAPVVERFTVNTPAPVVQDLVPVAPVETQTTTSDTATVVIDTATVLNDTSTVTFSNEFDWETFWIQFEIWFKTFFNEMWATP